GIPIIEDAAQAFGAQGVATTGVASTFSFFPTKNLFALGDGGLVAATEEDLHVRGHELAARRASGRRSAALPRRARRLEPRAARSSGALRRAWARRVLRAARGRARPRLPHVRRS